VAFSIPDFNLSAELFTMVVPMNFLTKVSRGLIDCQLRAYGPELRAGFSGQINEFTVCYGGLAVLCPAGTDIRDSKCNGACDLIELPAGSGRFYLVLFVDDVAKGFPNEYRIGYLICCGPDDFAQILNMPYWPTPIP